MCNPAAVHGRVDHPAWRDSALKGMLQDTYANDFPGEYAKVLPSAVADLSNLLSGGLDRHHVEDFVPAEQFAGIAAGKPWRKMIKLSKGAELRAAADLLCALRLASTCTPA